MLQVVQNPIANIVDERKVIAIASIRRPAQCLINPLGTIADHLMATDLQNREISDEADHGLFKELPLEDIAARAVFKGLNFPNEFTDILEGAINRHITHVGHRIDGVKLVHHLGPNRAGRNLKLVILMEFGKNFINGAANPIHRDLPFLTGFHKTTKELLAVDHLTRPIRLDDPKLGPLYLLVCRKSRATIQAFPAATNRGPILGTPGVHDLVVK